MILVAGATGSVGSRIARSLLADDEPVRALARPTADTTSLRGAGAEVVVGDLKDRASLARACAGVRALVTTASASKRGDDSIENVDLQGNLSLIDAARDAGVEHFVLLSTVGASPQSPLPVFRAKGEAEAHLKSSGMEWTVLQPTPFMDVWFGMLVELPLFSGQPVTLVGESRRRHSFIAEHDVAAFAVAALGHPEARHRTLEIGGPEAVTFREVVHAYEAAMGRPIDVRSVASGEPIPGLPEPVWGIAAALESFDNIVPTDELAARFGLSLTSVRSFARARLNAHAVAPRPA